MVGFLYVMYIIHVHIIEQNIITHFSIGHNEVLLSMHFTFCCVGKVFVYWLGTEPFLYIAEPEFLKKMSTVVMAKRWGKPSVFRNDRDPMFGSGLVMVEGNDWVRHRHIVAPAFNPINLKVSLHYILFDFGCLSRIKSMFGDSIILLMLISTRLISFALSCVM